MDLALRAGEIAREAGTLVRALSDKRDLIIREKGSPNDFVTEADLSSQELIKRRVAERFPGDTVIGEEDGRTDADVVKLILNNPKHSRLWLVDPLDGTINYIRGLSGYGVSVAVFDGSEVVAAAICQPDVDALYLAEPGAGAFCGDKRLCVADRCDIAACIGTTYVPADADRRAHAMLWNGAVCGACQNLRMMGVSTYEQTHVATGGFDFYYEIGPHPWDLAAGRLIVEEAGGRVTRLDGAMFDYGIGGVIAASRAIYPEVARLIRASDACLHEL